MTARADKHMILVLVFVCAMHDREYFLILLLLFEEGQCNVLVRLSFFAASCLYRERDRHIYGINVLLELYLVA
jgi:hypothetical protein